MDMLQIDLAQGKQDRQEPLMSMVMLYLHSNIMQINLSTTTRQDNQRQMNIACQDDGMNI